VVKTNQFVLDILQFSSVLKWIGQWYMPNGEIIHILDDFLIIAPGKDLCKLYLDRFLYICKQIGTPTGANFYKPFQCHSLPYKQVNHKVVW
jgi:hypothetical protein